MAKYTWPWRTAKSLTMQGGKLDTTITPKAIPGQGRPTRLFTNTDVKDLYLLRSRRRHHHPHQQRRLDNRHSESPAGMGLG